MFGAGKRLRSGCKNKTDKQQVKVYSKRTVILL